MKRRAVVVLCVLLALVVSVFPASIPAQVARVPVAQQEYIWIAANTGHPFYAEGKAGWDAAGKMLGVGKAQLTGPLTSDVQQQVTMMEQAIANPNTAGILLYPVDYTAIGPVAQKARDAGIPVVLGNGDAPDRSWRDAFVGTDNFALGRAAADLVSQALNGKGKVGIVSFITAQNHQDRVKGFEDRLKEAYPDLEVVGIAPEDGSPEKEAAAARAFLQAHPDVNLLWTTDAGSGIVANVIKEFGLEGKVLSVGTDRTTDQLDAVEDGTVYATITQDTYCEQFTSLVYLWLAYNNLCSLPDVTITKPLIINKDNVKDQMASPATRYAAEWPTAVADQNYMFLAANVGHPFYYEGKAGLDAAGKLLGVKTQLVGPVDPDVQQQVTILEQAAVNPTTGGILLYSMDESAVTPSSANVMAQGIPLILGNGDAQDKTTRDGFVGTANEALGAAAADLVAEALGGKGKIGIVSFITQNVHQDRVRGFENRIKEAHPDVEILGTAPEDGTPEKEAAATRAFLQAHPDVNLLWTTDAGSGVVANVLKEFGLEGKILSVGTDRTTDQLDAIQDGTVYATITQDTFAEEFISTLFLFLARNKLTSIPDTTITKSLIITKANVEEQMKPPGERFNIGWPGK